MAAEPCKYTSYVTNTVAYAVGLLASSSNSFKKSEADVKMSQEGKNTRN